LGSNLTPHTLLTVDKGYYVFEYCLYTPLANVIEVVYHNKRSNYRRVFRIYFKADVNLDLKVVDEAIKLADAMYRKIDAGVVKPNIPLYALLYLISTKLSGFSYRCKVKKRDCPIDITKVVEGQEYKVSIGSLLEQMYRVLKRYKPLE